MWWVPREMMPPVLSQSNSCARAWPTTAAACFYRLPENVTQTATHTLMHAHAEWMPSNIVPKIVDVVWSVGRLDQKRDTFGSIGFGVFESWPSSLIRNIFRELTSETDVWRSHSYVCECVWVCGLCDFSILFFLGRLIWSKHKVMVQSDMTCLLEGKKNRLKLTCLVYIIKRADIEKRNIKLPNALFIR